MTLTLNSNIFALRIGRSLAENGKELSRVFEQLSSGQRINHASDDAAGLSIADALNAKTRIFTQGIRNLNDGTSLISIADGALSSLVDITTRLKELAEQSANRVYSDKQRKAMDAEAQALSQEFTRVTKTTSFNGLNVFDGSVQGLQLQAGTGSDGSIYSGLGGSIGTGNIGTGTTVQSSVYTQSTTTGDIIGDGILDLISPDSAGVINIYFGKGDGTFGSRMTVAGAGNSTSIIAVDVSGDGILDLVTSEPGTSTASIFIGKGDGTFNARTTIKAGGGTNSISSGDFNGDGLLDLITTESGTNQASIFLGTGNGNFATRISVQTGSGPYSITTGDYNGDGILDFAVGNYSSADINIFLGKGNGTFTTGATLYTSHGSFSVTSGDMNGDGIMDIISSNYGKTLSIFLLAMATALFKPKKFPPSVMARSVLRPGT